MDIAKTECSDEGAAGTPGPNLGRKNASKSIDIAAIALCKNRPMLSSKDRANIRVSAFTGLTIEKQVNEQVKNG